MYILGILPFGYDPSACLLRDNKIIAMVEEERFIRIKHAYDHFPINAINFCLSYAKKSLDEIDYISIGWNARKYPNSMLKFYFKTWTSHKRIGLGALLWEFKSLIYHSPESHISRIKSGISKWGYNGNCPEIQFIPHHLSHAASAYFCSGFKEASILTLDGHGEENCTVAWKGKNNDITQIYEFNIPNSLGWFYAAFTEYLGFKAHNGEGKVMGLAPYGEFQKNIFNKMQKVINSANNGGYLIDPQYLIHGTHLHNKKFTDNLVILFGKPRKREGEINPVYQNIAYAAQMSLEQSAINLVKDLIARTSIHKLCISGGIGYNCKMNGKLLKLDCVDDIFIQPMSGDNGTSLGSALVLYDRLGGEFTFKMEDVYLGPEYSNEEIEIILKKNKIPYEYHDDISGICAELLSKGQVIGWFQGRMEVGPRALGNRSILADPRNAEMKDIVNKFKRREPWRPFAPSLLAESVDEFFINPSPSPFMILTFDVKPEKIKEIPAVVHIDGTTRPHTVEKRLNPIYWKLIKNFEEEAGVPIILNTSFNVRGEPIVCTPQDAINNFINTSLDGLAMGNYLIRKR